MLTYGTVELLRTNGERYPRVAVDRLVDTSKADVGQSVRSGPADVDRLGSGIAVRWWKGERVVWCLFPFLFLAYGAAGVCCGFQLPASHVPPPSTTYSSS